MTLMAGKEFLNTTQKGLVIQEKIDNLNYIQMKAVPPKECKSKPQTERRYLQFM